MTFAMKWFAGIGSGGGGGDGAEVPVVTKKRVRQSRTKQTELQSVPDLWRAFGLTESSRKNLPRESSRKAGDLTDAKGMSTMRRSVAKIATKTAEILCPGNPKDVLRDAARILVRQTAPKNEVEELGLSGTKVVVDAKHLVAVVRASPKGSVQARVARALLAKLLSRKDTDRVSRVTGLNLKGKIRSRAYEDFATIMEGEVLQKGKRRYDGEKKKGPGMGGRRPAGVPHHIVEAIDQLLEANPNMAPADGLQTIRAQFPGLDPTVEDKQIKSRFSAAKTRLKKKAREESNQQQQQQQGERVGEL